MDQRPGLAGIAALTAVTVRSFGPAIVAAVSADRTASTGAHEVEDRTPA